MRGPPLQLIGGYLRALSRLLNSLRVKRGINSAVFEENRSWGLDEFIRID